jgi:hypothetical protein
VWRAARLLLWALAMDVVLCFARVNAFFHAPFNPSLGVLNNYEGFSFFVKKIFYLNFFTFNLTKKKF